ncbi:MAG: DUF3307 domain-containing protein [Anaerolineales bacterium]|nr:DUF3307 domain-containing protein [Anaerolineales bacterium]
MFLSHLVGDFILQWDALAGWKSREFKGVLAHCGVVLLVTWLFALPFDAGWWRGVLFIGGTHLLIDAVQLYVRPPIPELLRFLLDQLAHLAVILIALVWGGFLDPGGLTGEIGRFLADERTLLILLGYAFVTMPTWVIAKFLAYGLVRGAPPNFPEGSNKYIGILERLLMTTFVMLGQFVLVPLVALPRLALEWPQVARSDRAPVYLVELLCGTALAVGTGLLLNAL